MMITVERKHLLALFDVVPKEEIRFYLNGVFVDVKELRIVATDGHRLITVPCEIEPESKKEVLTDLIISLPRCKPLKQKSGSLFQDVRILISSKGEAPIWEYPAEDTKYITKTIDGKYPDYKKVIPSDKIKKTSGTALAFNVSLLGDVLKTLGEVGVKLSLGANEKEAFTVEMPMNEDVKFIVMPMRI